MKRRRLVDGKKMVSGREEENFLDGFWLCIKFK